jgi:hypothetical protein
LVAAGNRQADTPSRGFYARLTAECERAGKGSGHVSSDGLLPTAIDHRHWAIELATLATAALQGLVRKAIVKSVHDGKYWTVTVQRHVIGALVRRVDGESYLAITSEGFYDQKLVAMLLGSVPGVPASDWIAEPGPVLGIDPDQGQIIFSTTIPPASLAALLEEDDGDYP